MNDVAQTPNYFRKYAPEPIQYRNGPYLGNGGGNNNRGNGNGVVGGLFLTGVESFAAAKGAEFLANSVGGNVSFGIPNSSGGRTFVNARPDYPNYGQTYGNGAYGFGGAYNGGYAQQVFEGGNLDHNPRFHDMVDALKDISRSGSEKDARKEAAQFVEAASAYGATVNGKIIVPEGSYIEAHGRITPVPAAAYGIDAFAKTVAAAYGAPPEAGLILEDAITQQRASRPDWRAASLAAERATQATQAAHAAQATPELMALLERATVTGDAQAAGQFVGRFNALRDINTNTLTIPETPMKGADGKEIGKIAAGTYDMTELAARAEALAKNEAGKKALDDAIAIAAEQGLAKRKGSAPAAPALAGAETASPAASETTVAGAPISISLNAKEYKSPIPGPNSHMTPEKIAEIQKMMVDAGLGAGMATKNSKDGIDGMWGEKTQAAFERAAKAAGIDDPSTLDLTQDNEKTRQFKAHLNKEIAAKGRSINQEAAPAAEPPPSVDLREPNQQRPGRVTGGAGSGRHNDIAVVEDHIPVDISGLNNPYAKHMSNVTVGAKTGNISFTQQDIYIEGANHPKKSDLYALAIQQQQSNPDLVAKLQARQQEALADEGRPHSSLEREARVARDPVDLLPPAMRDPAPTAQRVIEASTERTNFLQEAASKMQFGPNLSENQITARLEEEGKNLKGQDGKPVVTRDGKMDTREFEAFANLNPNMQSALALASKEGVSLAGVSGGADATRGGAPPMVVDARAPRDVTADVGRA